MLNNIDAARRLITLVGTTILHLQRLRREGGESPPAELFNRLRNSWAQRVFKLLHIKLDIKGEQHLQHDQARLFVGNHISYIDILLLFAIAQVTFVAKEEIFSWPIIGQCARQLKVIPVKRESSHSRQGIRQSIAQTITGQGQSLVVFPSGTTTLDESARWRWGAFRIAMEHQIPVQPFRLRYRPLREVAFIEDDGFVSHLWGLTKLQNIEAEVEFAKPVMIADIERDSLELQAWSREFLT